MLAWASFAALAVVLSATVGAAADSGGTTTVGECEDVRFGERSLRLGDCGDDVMTLNWVMKSKPYAARLDLEEEFKDPTHAAVREFQDRAGLSDSGVVNNRTREELKGTMTRKTASWYGPGFWGNQTACGQKLKHKTVGVAHKKLPCGTKVTFNKGGRWLRTKVIDRGPYIRGRTWDLTQKAAEALGMEYTESVRSTVIMKPGEGKSEGKGNE
jgi:rare lipoprotein A (peptidoglycan hydrolase)